MWGKGILNGLRITMRNMRRGPITVMYPDEKLVLPERARWAVGVKRFEDGTPRCTACLTCVRTCPDHILGMDVETREDKTKHIERFTYELGACMMCGLCVEACPTRALTLTSAYELSWFSRDDAIYTKEQLLEPPLPLGTAPGTEEG